MDGEIFLFWNISLTEIISRDGFISSLYIQYQSTSYKCVL